MSDDASKDAANVASGQTRPFAGVKAEERVSGSLMGDFVSQHGPIMMHMLDADGRIVEVNQCWLDRMGYTFEQVVGRAIWDFFTPGYAKRAASAHSEVIKRESSNGMVRELVTATGEILEVEVDARMIRNADGQMIRSIGAIFDVTQRNRQARELEAREQELRKLIDYSPDGIMIHCEGKYVYANRRACEILGAKDVSEIIGKGALDFIHPSVRDEVLKRIQNISGNADPSRPAETMFLRMNGDGITVESTGSPVSYQGKPAIQVVFRDITDRKRAETITRQNQVQSEVIRAQREMLLAVSTPLLPLSEHVLLMPLVGTMDDVRGDRATETLLQGIGDHAARIAIIDVTGVPEIGPAMAEGLRQTIQAAQLLGAEVVVTGIQPSIARTMIDLGLELTGIVTRATLKDGISYAFRRVRTS